MKGLRLLDGFEPVFIEDKSNDKKEDVENMPFSCASNLPACDGPLYSNTYWLPETVQELLDDIVDGMFGG